MGLVIPLCCWDDTICCIYISLVRGASKQGNLIIVSFAPVKGATKPSSLRFGFFLPSRCALCNPPLLLHACRFFPCHSQMITAAIFTNLTFHPPSLLLCTSPHPLPFLANQIFNFAHDKLFFRMITWQTHFLVGSFYSFSNDSRLVTTIQSVALLSNQLTMGLSVFADIIISQETVTEYLGLWRGPFWKARQSLRPSAILAPACHHIFHSTPANI